MDAMSQNSLSNYVKYADNAAVRCLYCDDDYLHHNDVAIYNRAGEDSNHGLAIYAKSDSVTINDDMAGNPSGRRNGLMIHFECENCSRTSKLALYQHKGVTYLHWVR
jgi:hypothetical protein